MAERSTSPVPAPANRDGGAGRQVRNWALGLLVVCVAALWLQFRHIDGALPYPWDTDEGFVSSPASRTIITGTLHPQTFNYPSLPKYLASVGMAVGFVRAASHVEIRDVHDIGSTAYPYYDRPRVMQGARQLFSLIAVIALAATGLAAWHAFRRPALIVLAPLVLTTSPLYFYHSWTYLNVDIVAMCFTTLTLAACLQGTRRPSLHQTAVIPGALAGLAAGSKYTLALIILPVLVACGLYLKRGQRMWGALAAIGMMIAAFLVADPFSVWDIPGFLSGIGWEAFHYARGHAGMDADPGLPQVLYYAKHFRAEVGIGGLVVAMVGAIALAVADWRRAAVLFVFPPILFAFLISQRVHFERNLLSVHPILAMCLANGILVLYGRAAGIFAARGWSGRQLALASASAALVLLAAFVPWWHYGAQLRTFTDSRKIAEAWIEERIPKGWAVIVPGQLAFDSRRLKADGWNVAEVDMQSAQDADAFQRLLGVAPGAAIVMVPHWGADPRFPGQVLADALNGAPGQLRVMKTFGSHPVLVNYAAPVPYGDPAFSIAVIGRQKLSE